MTLHKYLAYAGVTSPILLTIGFLIMIFQSWLARRTFRSNTVFAYAVQKESMKDLFGDNDSDFDDHVASAPGIRNL